MKKLNNYESVLMGLFSGANAIEMACSHSPLLVFLKSFNLIRLWFSSLDVSKNEKIPLSAININT
ncbi:hypothetical protein [Staphylococcus chromogenes]|nr:hypothetical protein [Staphylococcus chromogenes]MBW6089479.1 hypothetical protein [Staphylococcus chromogenes]